MSIMTFTKFSGYSPDGRRSLNFGGGGGGGQSQRDATAEERRLWAAQAGSLESISSVALPNLVTGMNNLGTMANESMDGTMATRMRGLAAADANQSSSMAIGAAGRNFDRYGSTLNPNAHASIVAGANLDFARNRTNAMNQANMGVEDIKWQRNAALTGLASGQGAQAVSGMGSLAGQIGQNRQASMQADAQSSQGLGMMGAMVGSKMFADGGAVTREPRFADGGGLRMYRPQGMPTTNPMQFGNTTDSGGPSQAGAFLTPMAGTMAMNYGAKNLLKPALEEGGKWLAGQAGTAVEGLGLGSTQAGAPVSTATTSTAAVDAASAEAAVAAAGEAAVADAAAAAAAEAAAAEAAAELAMLVVLKDGGGVQARGLRRKDMTPGGAVSGPGTATSDSVPARLSDGEFVENADAVKLPRSDTKQIVAEWAAGGGGSTRDLLKNINDAGLQKRYGGRRPAAAGLERIPTDGEVKMASGGLATLGQMARGYVPTAMALDQQAENTRRYDERLGLERASHAQTAELRGLQIENARMAQEESSRDRADIKAIREAGSAATMPQAGVTTAGLQRAPAPAMSMSPDAPASAVDSLVPQSVATQPRQAGLKNTNDTREDDRLFSASKGMYETALRLNRPDLAAGYYQQMTQNRDTLMARANDRADRVFRSTGNISGYVDSYNRYLADGNTIDAFKQNEDGSHTLTLNDGSGKPRDVNVPKERIGEYLMALRDPKRVQEIESRRAEMLFKAQTDAQEALNKPVAVGKDQTLVVPSTGQTFGGRRDGDFDPKEAGPVLDDISKIFTSKYGTADPNNPMAPKGLSDEGLAKASVAQRIFMSNRGLPPALIAEIADNGVVTTAPQRNRETGETREEPVVVFNGRMFRLGGGDAGRPTADKPPAGAAPPAGTAGLGTRSVSGKIGPGLQRVQPQSSADFPKVSQGDQFARDVEAGKILVAEVGGVPQAQAELAQMDAALKNPRLDGTSRGILQSHRNRMAAGIAAMSPRG